MFSHFHSRAVSHSTRRAVRALCHIVAAAGFLPIFILAPMGSGTILVHDHHDESLHAHKVAFNTEHTGNPVVSDGHEHADGSAQDSDGTRFVLTLPDLPRLSAFAGSCGPQVKSLTRSVVVRSLDAWSQQQVSARPSTGATDFHEGPLRAHDVLTRLLLTANALLI